MDENYVCCFYMKSKTNTKLAEVVFQCSSTEVTSERIWFSSASGVLMIHQLLIFTVKALNVLLC